LNHYLYRIQPTRVEMLTDWKPEESEIMSRHFAYLKGLVEKGVVILAGPTLVTDASNFGIVIFKAESEDAAREVMNNDPAVRHGVMKATLFPFRVSLISETYV
jgi:uncharacterized protein YciI